MKRVFDYLTHCGVFYLATCDKDQPRVRPFGALCAYEGKIYIVTHKEKKVYTQLLRNPKIEISAMQGDTWIRIQAEAVHDPSREARVHMMAANEAVLSPLYHVDDGLMEVFYLKNAYAAICSMTAEPEIITF